MTTWKCGRFQLAMGAKTYVMGIVNATPDSFSNDGIFRPGLIQSPIEHALQMMADGADILDIGGESTRPGAAVISMEEELQRIIPLVEALANEANIPISVDTTKAEVARQALAAGASIINDISGATFDETMLDVLSQSDCGVVLMHLRGTPQSMGWSARMKKPDGAETPSDLINEIQHFWRDRVEAAEKAGIDKNRICLDAGFGFGKSLNENLEILRCGRELRDFGYPILSGTSRKSTIGKVIGIESPDERIWGTAATVAISIQNGADIVRVHDVREMGQVARMTDAIVR